MFKFLLKFWVLQDFTSFPVFSQISYHLFEVLIWSNSFPFYSSWWPGVHPTFSRGFCPLLSHQMTFILTVPKPQTVLHSSTSYMPWLCTVWLLALHFAILFSNCLYLHFIPQWHCKAHEGRWPRASFCLGVATSPLQCIHTHMAK